MGARREALGANKPRDNGWLEVVGRVLQPRRQSLRPAVQSFDIDAVGLAFGIGFFGVLLYWIGLFGILPLSLLAAFQSLYIVIFVIIAKLAVERIGAWGRFLFLPALWVVVEWLRSLGMFGFTWGDLGYSQYKVLPVIQIASVTGVWGVSFILAMANTALLNLALSWKTKARRDGFLQVVAAAVLVLAVVTYGFISINRPIDRSGRMVRVAIVQGNFNSDTDWDFDLCQEMWRTYTDKTTEVKGKADLVIWPESAAPGNTGNDPSIQLRLANLAAGTKSHLLIGGWDEDHSGKMYNTAFLIGGFGIVGKYAKVHLVPLGEFIPKCMRCMMPLLKSYRVVDYDTTPGSGFLPVDTGKLKIGTAICFESIFPQIPRLMTAHGADMLCVITNDSWFGRTSAPEQHMSMSVFRAIENRRYLVRGAATGISCIIDSRGRVLSKSGIYKPAVIEGAVWPEKEQTPYTRYGDWVVWLSMALILLIGASGFTRRRK